MGSGKSRVGREVSKRLNRIFLDIDSLIESREDKNILDIFAENGEEYFRDIEREFAGFIKGSISNSVISVGGGFPTAVSNVKELGYVVYLDIDFDFMLSELQKRKGEIDKRPLLQNIEMAKKIYESRREVYQKSADLIIKVDSSDLHKIVEQVLQFF
jgi:shikimate kinase